MILPLTTGNQRLYNQLTTNVVPNLLLWFTLISFCCESHHFRQLFHQRGLANWNDPSINVHTLEAKEPGDMIFFHNSIAYGRGRDGRLWVLRSRRENNSVENNNQHNFERRQHYNSLAIAAMGRRSEDEGFVVL